MTRACVGLARWLANAPKTGADSQGGVGRGGDGRQMNRARSTDERAAIQRPPLIAVIGGSMAPPEEVATAEAVGRGLAERGAVLICGGRSGVMEAACRGAKSAGGLTIGILPGTAREEANPYVDVPIVTGIGEARNVIVVRSAQAVIAIGGSYGTLTEIAYALLFGTPVVALNSWEIARPGHPPPPIHHAATPEEAVALALRLGRAGATFTTPDLGADERG